MSRQKHNLRWLLPLYGIIFAILPSVCQAQRSDAPKSGSTLSKPEQLSPRPAGNLVMPRLDEDWTTPSLKTTHLRLTTPIVAEKVDRGTYTREMVSLQWRPFDAIYVYIIKPKGVAKPPPVLYLYGYPSSTKRFTNDRYCRAITAGGCAAIGFDPALSGERFRMRPMREGFVSEMPESLATSAHDVQLILDYLATRGDLDVSHTGIFGQGSGATISILAAAVEPRIKAVDLLTPWGDWPDWVQKTTKIPEKDRTKYTQVKFLKSVAPLDPVLWLPKLRDKHVRMQLLESDNSVSTECRQALVKSSPPNVEQVTYEGIPELYAASSGGSLFDWMAKQLNAKPAPTQTTVAVPTKH